MTHTKTPLVLDRKHVHGDARYITTMINGVPVDIAKLPYNVGIPESEVDANAKRIADCVNACADVPQEAIDGGFTAKRICEYAMALEIQRDLLLSALKGMMQSIPECQKDDQTEAARNIILRSEGPLHAIH